MALDPLVGLDGEGVGLGELAVPVGLGFADGEPVLLGVLLGLALALALALAAAARQISAWRRSVPTMRCASLRSLAAMSARTRSR